MPDLNGCIKSKKLILYDLDGTLVDTGEDIAFAANAMLQELHGVALPEAEIRQLVGHGLHDLVARCLQTNDSAVVANGVELFGTHYGRHLFDHSRLYPCVRELLDYFCPRAQAIVTNKPHPYAEELMRGLGVAECFFAIVSGGSGYPKKPDPTAVHAMMQRAQARPDETLLIGDSPVDIETGRRAGIATVIVRQGFAEPEALAAAKPEMLVDDMAAVLALAQERGW
jgi:phosphoglycolate phosphatase